MQRSLAHHDYLGDLINEDVIWEVVTQDLGSLKEAVEKMLLQIKGESDA
jgi:uncharacterized protein with HEPN domain